jgi:hypothetical protein
MLKKEMYFPAPYREALTGAQFKEDPFLHYIQVHKTFYGGYSQLIHIISNILGSSTDPPNIPYIKAVRDYVQRISDYNRRMGGIDFFCSKGGRVMYALDCIVSIAAGEGKWKLEEGEEEERRKLAPAVEAMEAMAAEREVHWGGDASLGIGVDTREVITDDSSSSSSSSSLSLSWSEEEETKPTAGTAPGGDGDAAAAVGLAGNLAYDSIFEIIGTTPAIPPVEKNGGGSDRKKEKEDEDAKLPICVNDGDFGLVRRKLGF